MAALVLGWLIVLLDHPIYMLYEGRLWWPQWLRNLAIAQQEARLAKIIRRGADKDDPQHLEWELKERDYPISKNTGDPHALYPTRLGNLLAATEGYSSRIYGADGVFYWYRIWLVMDKDQRVEVDQTQSIADSGLYSSFCLAIAGVLALAYGLMATPRPFDFLPIIELPFVADQSRLIAVAVLLVALSYAVYRIHLYPQRQYGELVMALYDQYLPKLTFVKSVAWISMDRGGLSPNDQAETYQAASLYLRWYRVRPAVGAESRKPS